MLSNIEKVGIISRRLDAAAMGWEASLQNLDALLMAVQEIERLDAEPNLRSLTRGVELPEMSA